MASTSKAAAEKLILTPLKTLKGHGAWIGSMSYFADGQRMMSGSRDKTTRQWDLKEGKEIEDVRVVCKEEVRAVAVSGDSRWVVTGGGDGNRVELKVCDVETGIVKKLQGHSQRINYIDISVDNALLASGSSDKTSRIWNLETGELVAGPFESEDWVGAVRFSTDSRKLAVKSDVGKYLEVWDLQAGKLDARIGNGALQSGTLIYAPIFWTNKNKNILAAFSFTDDEAKTIYEFDASTLQTVGTPFKGHTKFVSGLALSFDGALLVSASYHDNTIKLWAFESRQLLASFDAQNPWLLILSPDSRKLAYTTHSNVVSHTRWQDYKDIRICICDTPPDILAKAQADTIAPKKPARALSDPLNPDGTRRSVAGCRKRPIYIPPAVHPPPTTTAQQPSFRLSKFLRFPLSARMNKLWPSLNNQLRDPLDSHATLPLPLNRSPSPPLPSGRSIFNHVRSSVKGKQRAHAPPLTRPQTVGVPLGQATYADVIGVDNGERPYVLFFCLSWFQKKKQKEVPQPPVYDDEFEDDEEDDVPDAVAVPLPVVWEHEEIEMKPVISRSQPVAGPSALQQPTT